MSHLSRPAVVRGPQEITINAATFVEATDDGVRIVVRDELDLLIDSAVLARVVREMRQYEIDSNPAVNIVVNGGTIDPTIVAEAVAAAAVGWTA